MCCRCQCGSPTTGTLCLQSRCRSWAFTMCPMRSGRQAWLRTCCLWLSMPGMPSGSCVGQHGGLTRFNVDVPIAAACSLWLHRPLWGSGCSGCHTGAVQLAAKICLALVDLSLADNGTMNLIQHVQSMFQSETLRRRACFWLLSLPARPVLLQLAVQSTCLRSTCAESTGVLPGGMLLC